MKSTKKTQWPELEACLRAWVLEQRVEGRELSTVQLRLKVQTRAKEMEHAGFAGKPSRIYEAQLHDHQCVHHFLKEAAGRLCRKVELRGIREETSAQKMRSRYIILSTWMKFC